MTLRTIPATPATQAQRRQFSEKDVVKGRMLLPRRIFAFGGEKVGKSTHASGAPDPVFIPLDEGAPHLDIERLPKPESFDELLDLVSMPERLGRWKTLVLDPINWAEEMVWARMLHGPDARPSGATRDEIEKYGGGFQKGYDAAVGTWRLLQGALERQWKRGMNVILLAHAKKTNFKDPSGVAYDRWEPAMHEKAAGIFKQWVDDVLFLRHEILAKPDRGRMIAVETGERIIHTTWSKAWDAGNRASLPPELPMGWGPYWSAVEAGLHRSDALKKEIGTLIEAIADREVTRKATAMVSEARDNAERLAEVANALRVKLAEVQSAPGAQSISIKKEQT